MTRGSAKIYDQKGSLVRKSDPERSYLSMVIGIFLLLEGELGHGDPHLHVHERRRTRHDAPMILVFLPFASTINSIGLRTSPGPQLPQHWQTYSIPRSSGIGYFLYISPSASMLFCPHRSRLADALDADGALRIILNFGRKAELRDPAVAEVDRLLVVEEVLHAVVYQVVVQRLQVGPEDLVRPSSSREGQ